MAYSDDPSAIPFNMSIAFLQALMSIREKITECRFNRNLEGWYRLNHDFYDLCALVFTDDESADVEKRLNEIKSNLNVPHTREGRQLAELKIPAVEGKLSELTRLLFIYLDKHERIFPKNQWDDPIDKIEAEYR